MVIDSFRGPYAFLSNMYPYCDEFEYEGIRYQCVEAAYQAAKLDPAKPDTHRRRLGMPGFGHAAKKTGKSLPLRANWLGLRVGIMRELIALKFARGGVLAGHLLATGDAELIEGNTWGDRFWGVCKGVGQNQLGKLLMERRAELQQQYATATPAGRPSEPRREGE